jgi:DNA-binding NarL/FixJ family response regulator
LGLFGQDGQASMKNGRRLFSRNSSPPVILVVDDSELARAVVEETLERAGFRVIGLESAFGFIKTVRERSPALILLDVGLASMNGTKLVELGRQHAPPHTRIVLYSGRDDATLAEDVRKSKADGFIHKRTTDKALALAIQSFLG